ncbi:hypothetical protein EWM64_g2087 [Hericium alpestre]|uniref:Uncharacterized protein n=1 Tax=Hericium alpestre TaxID=135208 RepID=A0A4Z0A8L2_9AGAM|nr:hypothetical protein EWM64_g2087 [Hericium alpestre]
MPPQPPPDDIADGTLAPWMLPNPPNANDVRMTMSHSRMLNTQGVTARDDAIIDDARSRIDRKLQDITNILILGKKCRNSLAHVSRLPTEVLASIFMILADLDPPMRVARSPGESVESVLYKRLGWIRTTHVCTSWRQQALTRSGLWKNIAVGFTPHWMVELMHRSRPVPFVLNMSVTNDVERDPVRNVVEVVSTPDTMARLKVLHVKTLFLEYMNSLLDTLVYPAPLLEDLELHTGIYVGSSSRPIPGTAFNSTMPKLRRLALEDCMPSSWDMPYLRNLTSLELTNIRQTTQCLITISDCLEMLSHSPHLELLILKDAFNLSEGRNYDGPPIALDRLSKLNLKCAVPELIQILRTLQVPVTSTVEIGFFGLHDGLSDLIKFLHPFSGAGVNHSWRMMIICNESENVPWHFLKLSIVCEGPFEGWEDSLLKIRENMRMNDVAVLALGGDAIGRLKKKRLQSILRCMPALWALRLVGQATGNAVALLQKPVANGKGGEKAICPALTSLSINGVRLSEMGLDSQTYCAMLLAVLQARQALEVPNIVVLELLKCDYEGFFLVEKLREHVPHLTIEPY